MPRMSQAAPLGEGIGYCCCCCSCCSCSFSQSDGASRLPTLLVVVDERLRLEAVELRRASARAALCARALPDERLLSL